MTAIDRAALIEVAAKAVRAEECERLQSGDLPPLLEWGDLSPTVRHNRKYSIGTALPVIAAGLLAPLRELHRDEWDCGNPQHTNPDYDCPECEVWCESCGVPFPCPTVRLLDQIEADCKGGE